MMRKRKIYKTIFCVALAFFMVGVFSLSGSAAVIDEDFGENTDLYTSDLFTLMKGEVKMYSYPPLANETVYTYLPSQPMNGGLSSYENTFAYSVDVTRFRNSHNLGEYLDPGADDHRIMARYSSFFLVPRIPSLTSFSQGDELHLQFNIRLFVGFDSNSVNVTIHFNAPGFNSISTAPVIYKQAFNGSSPNNLISIDWIVPVNGVRVAAYEIKFDRQSGGVGDFDFGKFGNSMGIQDFSLTLDRGSFISDRVPQEEADAQEMFTDWYTKKQEIDDTLDSAFSERNLTDAKNFMRTVLDPHAFGRDTSFFNSFKIWGNIFVYAFDSFELSSVFYAFLGIGSAFLVFGVVASTIRNIKNKTRSRGERRGRNDTR